MPTGSSVKLLPSDEKWINDMIAKSRGEAGRTMLLRMGVKLLRMYVAAHGHLPVIEIENPQPIDGDTYQDR